MTMEPDVIKVADDSVEAATSLKQRKKRKWDQPAEAFLSAGLAVPGISLPGVAQFHGLVPIDVLPSTCVSAAQILQVPILQQNAAAIVQKLTQTKIQDELIAKEIVINDAEPTIRYKLTKRQTQEEIQKCTGAVVITRGKYRPPNGLPAVEKPLYLHISAGAHLKEISERIKAVDSAAAMVEDILKQGHHSPSLSTSITFHSAMNVGVTQPMNLCVFLHFEPNPSLNVAARIRGPNDQYINHIMNETGAKVILRGIGSGNFEDTNGKELQQPLHLFLSSNNPKSLEDARLLAENLLNTISVECGASRAMLSTKGYNAVPPPQLLLTETQISVTEQKIPVIPSVTSASTLASPICPPSMVSPSSLMSAYTQPQVSITHCPQPLVSGGTNYSGYEGIYPQATPLQQVALALRHSSVPSVSILTPTTIVSTLSKESSSTSPETNKRPPQRRKFQELPVTPRKPAKLNQNLQEESDFVKPGVFQEESGTKNVADMPPPNKLLHSGLSTKFPSELMPPPPPVKCASPSCRPLQNEEIGSLKFKKSTKPTASDTLMKLMDYGDEDDSEETDFEADRTNSIDSFTPSIPKPFWAV